jgi:hypothetical protein
LLVQDYGASETYNDAQITACVRRAKLPEAGLLMARAAFLPAGEFEQKFGNEYATLRKLFKDSVPVIPTQQMTQTSNDPGIAVGLVYPPQI